MENYIYNIKVCIRIRPVIKRELNNNSFIQCIASKENNLYISKINKPIILSQNIESNSEIETFAFNHIFDESSTQENIFNKIGIDLINSTLNGFNTTIFAYGQTGSGKTYTIEGTESNPGILPNIINYLFDKSKSENLSINMSALQIYMENLNDLLSDENVTLSVFKNSQGFECKNLTEITVQSAEHAINIFNTAKNKRIVNSTLMNNVSSRGHLIYTLKIFKILNDKSLCYSKFNLVDLAGSERINKSGASGESLKEAIFINKSLFALQGVVEALTNKKSIHKKTPPFRDSYLTMLLKDSLGGNCITHLIANISPSLTECSESLSTLKFASSCAMILNDPRKNIRNSNEESKIRLYGKEKEKIKKQNIIKLPWKEIKISYCYKSIITEYGELFYIENDLSTNIPTYTLLLLHASYSSAEEFIHWLPSLTFHNIRVIALDQPGFGMTKGKTNTCNSLSNLERGGPCDVVLSLIKALNLNEKLIVGGYDWGAGIALSLCSRYAKLFEKAIIFLPSYAEPTGNELKCITTSVLIIWVDLDQFHIWSKWKKLADKIPKKVIQIIKIKSYNRDIAGNCYEGISDQLMRFIVIHLGFPDPMKEIQDIIDPVSINKNDINGNLIVAKLNINFKEEFDLLNTVLCSNDEISYEINVKKFVEIFNQIGDDIYERYFNKNPEITSIFRGLPEISHDVLTKNPTLLVQLKVWKNMPKNYDSMWMSPKYFKNRRVLILIPCSPIRQTNGIRNENYLKYDPLLMEKFISPYGMIISYDNEKDEFIIETIGVDNNTYILNFSVNEIFLLNNGQIFKVDNMNHLQLEDGIKANYSNPIVKAKLLEICMKLSNTITSFDFLHSNIDILQKEAILIIRKSLNLISFYKGLDRQRYGRTDCIGKLSVFGQAQCHGLSSTMSGYLYPLSNLLGIELLYRGGFSFINMMNSKENIIISNTIEKHQWLQVNLRPSMNSYIIDLWYQEQFKDDSYLFIEIMEGINKVSYPHPKLLLKNEFMKRSENDFSF